MQDPEKQRATNRASYAKRIVADPDYSRRRSAKWANANPEANRAKTARWRAKQPPPTEEQRLARKEYNARYYAEHGEEMRAKQRERNADTYAADPEKSQKATKRWAQANPEKGANRQARRRARKLNAPRHEKVDRLVVAERDGWICQECFEPIDPTIPYKDPETGRCNPGYLNADHIIPLSKGGEHTYENHQATHSRCNKFKAARLPSVD